MGLREVFLNRLRKTVLLPRNFVLTSKSSGLPPKVAEAAKDLPPGFQDGLIQLLKEHGLTSGEFEFMVINHQSKIKNISSVLIRFGILSYTKKNEQVV